MSDESGAWGDMGWRDRQKEALEIWASVSPSAGERMTPSGLPGGSPDEAKALAANTRAALDDYYAGADAAKSLMYAENLVGAVGVLAAELERLRDDHKWEREAALGWKQRAVDAERDLEVARQEVEEWKVEADRGKWPKDKAQEFFRLRQENERLTEALRKARQLCLEGECSLARIVMKEAIREEPARTGGKT